ncbi:CesT family type III secretion system chaperone [Chitinimonas lacunae]|uniref:CesT family type III secretion system chaperone n=1 Tax=Chitinimonas lacunae TaxID=1963018 RepID=A0ABV8MNX5_9NEIS
MSDLATPVPASHLSQWLDDFLPGLCLNAYGVAEFSDRNGLHCLLCHDPALDRLYFSATLLYCDPTYFPLLSRTALQINWLQHASDGGAVALDEEGAALHYCLLIELAGLDAARLGSRLDRAVSTARQLAARLQADHAEALLPPLPLEPAAASQPALLMRV